MKIHRQKTGVCGFTITEILVALTIATLVIGSTTMAFINGLRTWRTEMIKSELNINLEIATERIRQDLRLSSVGIGLMAFYPATGTVYTAFSIPLATPGNDGLLTRDAAGKIIWDKTVVYHVRTGSPDELLRTVYSPRKTNATPSELYGQLLKTVQATNTAGLQAARLTNANGVVEAVASKVIFANLVKLYLRPPEVRFDGYAPSYRKAKTVNWGSIVLTNGMHDLKFTVVDKNPLSSGYSVGFDKFALSASDSAREGEMYLRNSYIPSGSDGAPSYAYTISGGSVSAQVMSAYGASWSGDAQLTFTPPSSNHYINFKVFNDLWCDTHFDDQIGLINSNTSRQKIDSFASSSPYIPDICLALQQGIAWSAANCTEGDIPSFAITNSDTIYNIIWGGSEIYSKIILNGVWARFYFEAGSNDSLFINDVYIAEMAANTNPVSGTIKQIYFSGSTSKRISANTGVWSDWLDTTINRDKSYLVYFDRKTDSMAQSCARGWVSTKWHMSYIDGDQSPNLVGISKIEVRYPDQGIYRSGIFDTHIINPAYRKLNWTHVENYSAGDIDIRARSGDNPDLSDAGPWISSTYFQNPSDANSLAGIGAGRYLQYEALFTTDGSPAGSIGHTEHLITAYLRDVTIEWTPPTGICDLTVDLGQGPNYGIIGATVDGNQFIKGLEIDMEIYKTGPFGTNKVSGLMEVRPLNTAK
jgi:hypothetical protein